MGTKLQEAKDTLSTRVSKLESVNISRCTMRLQLAKEHGIHRNQNITADKLNAIDKKFTLSLGEVFEQLEKIPSCKESLIMYDIDNGTELDAEMM